MILLAAQDSTGFQLSLTFVGERRGSAASFSTQWLATFCLQ